MAALELRLENVVHAPPDADFRLQGWELPDGMRCMMNAARERLHTFPLQASNTLFLAFEQGNTYCATDLLQVQGPGEVISKQEVSLIPAHGQSLERRIGSLINAGLRAGDKNPANYLYDEDATQLETGEQLARQYIRAIDQLIREAFRVPLNILSGWK